jgi:hypothetical protein
VHAMTRLGASIAAAALFAGPWVGPRPSGATPSPPAGQVRTTNQTEAGVPVSVRLPSPTLHPLRSALRAPLTAASAGAPSGSANTAPLVTQSTAPLPHPPIGSGMHRVVPDVRHLADCARMRPVQP